MSAFTPHVVANTNDFHCSLNLKRRISEECGHSFDCNYNGAFKLQKDTEVPSKWFIWHVLCSSILRSHKILKTQNIAHRSYEPLLWYFCVPFEALVPILETCAVSKRLLLCSKVKRKSKRFGTIFLFFPSFKIICFSFTLH